MKKYLIFLVLLLVLVTGCADVDTCVSDGRYGFWSGVWHGAILLFSTIGSIIDSNIAIYAVNNNGNWYDIGFFFGTAGFIRFFIHLIGSLFAFIAGYVPRREYENT